MAPKKKIEQIIKPELKKEEEKTFKEYVDGLDLEVEDYKNYDEVISDQEDKEHYNKNNPFKNVGEFDINDYLKDGLRLKLHNGLLQYIQDSEYKSELRQGTMIYNGIVNGKYVYLVDVDNKDITPIVRQQLAMMGQYRQYLLKIALLIGLGIVFLIISWFFISTKNIIGELREYVDSNTTKTLARVEEYASNIDTKQQEYVDGLDSITNVLSRFLSDQFKMKKTGETTD